MEEREKLIALSPSKSSEIVTPQVSLEYSDILANGRPLSLRYLNSKNSNTHTSEPEIIPEITWRGLFLTVILSLIMTSSNIYLGLFTGMTISVSIPCAIIAMSILRYFKSNILEINSIQVGASAGTSIASGIIYTIPAISLLGCSVDFYWIFGVAVLGGMLGVLCVIPIRRVLIVEAKLRYPEAVATTEVMRVSENSTEQKSQVTLIAIGALVGFVIKLGQQGFQLWNSTFETGWLIGGAYLFYFAINTSPALMSVGYIVGLPVSLVLLVGGIINWWVTIPVYYSIVGSPISIDNPTEIALSLWRSNTKYLGVGAMLIGGFGSIIALAPSMIAGIKQTIALYRKVKDGSTVKRTQRDIPLPFIFYSLLIAMIPIFLILFFYTHNYEKIPVWVPLLLTVFVMIFGFLFAGVGAYMTGIVGSSNNPVSGMTLATIAISCLILFEGLNDDFENTSACQIGPASAIFVGAFVCTAAASGGDMMQDLKTAHLIGATPLKVQIMRIVGIFIPSMAIAPMVYILIKAYGLGDDHPNPLPAPQASMIYAVSLSIFRGNLPVKFMAIGMGVAVAVIAIDFVLQKCKSPLRFPVLAAALGLYLPLELSITSVLGGLISSIARYILKKSGAIGHTVEMNERNGLLFAAGIITGESIVGIIIAIPVAINASQNPLALFDGYYMFLNWPGLLLLFLAMLTLLGVVVGKAYWDDRRSFYGRL